MRKMTNKYHWVNKGFKSFSFILFPLYLCLLFCSKSSTTEPEPSRPQVEVTEDITEDTVWESGRDYIVQGSVIVQLEATLSIEKDVHVFFKPSDNNEKGQLEVYGKIFIGTNDSTKRIIFKSLFHGQDEELQNGIYMRNSTNLTSFTGCSFNYLLYGIQVLNSRISISNCNFEKCNYGIKLSRCDSFFVSNCKFIENNYCIKIELSQEITDSSISIRSNYFSECSIYAIEINNQSVSYINDNVFKNCTLAILNQNGSKSNIRYNNFIDCDEGIYYANSQYGNISNNIFTSGDIFVKLGQNSNINVNFNNFDMANDYNIQIKLGNDVINNAENNWWGTTQISEIERLIYEEIDDNSEVECGSIDYEPFATSRYTDNCGIRE